MAPGKSPEQIYFKMKGQAMISFDKYLDENLKNEEFAKHYEEEKLLQDIAVKIAKIREEKGLTQSQLARQAKLTQQQVSKLESGINSNIMTLLKVCSALHVKLFVVNDNKASKRRKTATV